MENFIFTWPDIQVLRQPGVYIFRYYPTGRALYIGSTKYGIGRAFERDHHIAKRLKQNFYLEFFVCESHKAALAMERELIQSEKPALNEYAGKSKEWDREAADAQGY